MRASLPLLSMGEDAARSNPSQSTSSHCKINKSSWPNKAQISENKYEAIINHAYKRSKKAQITFMDKNIDLIINSKFIGIPTNTPQKDLHHMHLQETIVLRIKRERERKQYS